MNDQTLQSLGFEKILIDYWRKGNFGVYCIWKGDELIFYVSGVNDYGAVKSVEHLKEIYREETGEDLG